MTNQESGPEILVGEQLNAVTFVMDYVQIHFNGPVLTFLVPVLVRAGERRFVFPGPGGRDALCELIGAEVASVEANESIIEIAFSDGRLLSVSMAEEHRSGPEAAHFQPRSGGPLMVW
jgi:hypothetical protein